MEAIFHSRCDQKDKLFKLDTLESTQRIFSYRSLCCTYRNIHPVDLLRIISQLNTTLAATHCTTDRHPLIPRMQGKLSTLVVVLGAALTRGSSVEWASFDSQEDIVDRTLDEDNLGGSILDIDVCMAYEGADYCVQFIEGSDPDNPRTILGTECKSSISDSDQIIASNTIKWYFSPYGSCDFMTWYTSGITRPSPSERQPHLYERSERTSKLHSKRDV